MATIERREDHTLESEQSSPLGVQIALLIGFVVLAVVGVVTVVIPEVTDDGDEEPRAAQEEQQERGTEGASDAPGPSSTSP